MQVVRAAVENGTIHQLMGQSKSKVVQNADPRQLSKVRPPRPPVTSPARLLHATLPPLPAAGAAAAGGGVDVSVGAPGTVTVCAMCGEGRPAEAIAVVVGGEAFCQTCDRMRRRANNLGLSTQEVIELHRAGHLTSVPRLSLHLPV